MEASKKEYIPMSIPKKFVLLILLVTGPWFFAQAESVWSTDAPCLINATVHAEICQGEEYLFGERVLSTSGVYYDTVHLVGGCDSVTALTLSVVEPAPIVVCSDTVITPGTACSLWVRGADYYVWTPGASLSDSTAVSPVATPATTTTYTVYAYTDNVESRNLVVNGDFEQLNHGFSSDLQYHPAGTAGGSAGNFTIGPNSSVFGWRNSNSGYGGSGNFMIVDGSTEPNATVWQQTVNVEPNTMYAFAAEVMSLWDSNTLGRYALLQFSVNGQQVGPIFHSPDALDQWYTFYDTWYSGTATSATLRIINQNTNQFGNDFGLDHIVFIPLSSCPSVASVTVFVGSRTADIYESVCETDLPYIWNGQFCTEEGTYSYTCQTLQGRDSITILHLSVVPELYTELSATITDGDLYEFGTRYLTLPGTYCDTLLSTRGCDSIVCVELSVLERDWTVSVPDVCADDNQLVLDFMVEDVSGKHYSILFDDAATAAGFIDVVRQPLEAIVEISLPVQAGRLYTIPNHYKAVVILHIDDTLAHDQRSPFEFDVLYPSWLLRRKWENIIGVQNAAYNDGYQFSAFQWYRNGQPIEGATGDLYREEPSLAPGEYQAMLTRTSDGVSMLTCSYTISGSTGIENMSLDAVRLYPTLVPSFNSEVFLFLPYDAEYELYTTDGHFVLSGKLKATVPERIIIPSGRGVYVVYCRSMRESVFIGKVVVY